MTRKTRVLLAVVLASSSVAIAGKKHYRRLDNGCRNGHPVTKKGVEALQKRQACNAYKKLVRRAMQDAKTFQEQEDIYMTCAKEGTAWDHRAYHEALRRVLHRYVNSKLEQPKFYLTLDGQHKLRDDQWARYFTRFLHKEFVRAQERGGKQGLQELYEKYENNLDQWNIHPDAVSIFQAFLAKNAKK